MALTPEELRQRIANWSLESDGQLLQYMISIAKNLEEKCARTRDSLNSLMLQVNQTEVKLANATNQFSAVEQVKFVENRVEEDDESFYGLRRRRHQQQVEHGKEKANQEQDAEQSLDDLIQLTVERSIEGMYKSYDKVTLDLTDSDTSDGEETSEEFPKNDAELGGGKASVMRAIPRYPFIDRPLPHVIGSKEWQNKWHVGLIDSDDESSSERKEEYSESSSDTDDDGGMFPSQPNSKNHTPSESESSIWGADVCRKRAPSIDPSITGDDGSSVYSYASSSKPRTFPTHPVRGTATIGGSLKPPSLLPEEPPEEVNNAKSREGKGLFDDSPEDQEPVPRPRQTVPHSHNVAPFFKGSVHQPVRKLVNLFDDEPPPPQEQVDRVPEPKKSINLFIDSEDEEEAIENTRNNNTQRTVLRTKAGNMEPKPSANASGPTATNPRTMTKLVDELNNNFLKKQPDSKPETVRRNIPNSSSRFGAQRPTMSNLFDPEPPVDDFDQLFNASNASVKPIPRSQSAVLPQPAFRTSMEKKMVNLFADDDDDEDDDDGIVVGSHEQQSQPVRNPFISPNRISLPKQPERRITSKKKSIFDESDSEEEKANADSPLFDGSEPGRTTASKPVRTQSELSVKPPQTVLKSIFSDSSEAEDDDDELFGHSSNIVKNKLDALKRNGVGKAADSKSNEQTSTKKHPIAKEKSEPTKSKSLFDEDSDDGQTSADSENSLFGSELLSKLSSTKQPVVSHTTVPVLKVSLFDDELTTDNKRPVDRGRAAGEIQVQEEESNRRATGGKIPNAATELRSNNGVSERMIVTDDDVLGSDKKAPTIKQATDVKIFSVLETNPESGTSASVGNTMVQSDPLSLDAERVEQTNAVQAAVTKVDSNAPAGSIRSMILKKSIFYSDSESEQDSYIRSSSSKTESIEKPDYKKCDTEEAQFGLEGSVLKTKETEQINGTSSSYLNKSSEKESADQHSSSEKEKSSITSMHSPAISADENKHNISNISTNAPTSISSESSQKSASTENMIHEQTEKAVKESIFEDEDDVHTFVKQLESSMGSLDKTTTNPTDRAGTVPSNVVGVEKEKKFGQTVLLEKSKGDDVPISSGRSHLGLNAVQEEKNGNIPKLAFTEPIANDIMIPLDHEVIQSTAMKDESVPEQPTLGMIANDIDYFLRTNGSGSSNQPFVGDTQQPPATPPPARAETKSALNFNSIGLFDDMPPPDDEGDVDAYAQEQPKHFHSVDPASSLPTVDDPSGYPRESQSLTFIPNGSAGDNNRTRYLFDDEPPPDEADNSSTNANYSHPFRNTVSKALFDDRQRNSDAPVSLPPMSQDTTKDPQRAKVNKLNTKLAINVAALLPGARRLPPPTAASVKKNESPETVSDRNVFGTEDPIVSNTPTQAHADVSNAEKLTSLNKGRARIPTKRKPPSRQTLRAAVPSQKDRKDGDLGEAADRVVVGSEGKMLHIETGVTEACLTQTYVSPDLPYARVEEFDKRDISKMDPLIDRLSASVRNTSTRTVRPDGIETVSVLAQQVVPKQLVNPAQQKPESIFADSDSNDDGDADNFFSNLATKLPSKELGTSQSRKASAGGKNTRSIFGSDEDEDDDGMGDIFGARRSNTVVQLSASVKPHPPKGTTSLFGDDDNDGADDDDLFGTKTKSIPKALGTKPANKTVTTPLTTTTITKATTTRVMKDPLADLLDS